jgi:hypothetical protein
VVKRQDMDDVLLEIVVWRPKESPLAEGPTDLLPAAFGSEESLWAQSATLSRACHHHLYELAPTASELSRWLNEAAELVTLVQGNARPIDRGACPAVVTCRGDGELQARAGSPPA